MQFHSFRLFIEWVLVRANREALPVTSHASHPCLSRGDIAG